MAAINPARCSSGQIAAMGGLAGRAGPGSQTMTNSRVSCSPLEHEIFHQAISPLHRKAAAADNALY